jgi:uncharacterized phage infection (PIP) family protein YhgE
MKILVVLPFVIAIALALPAQAQQATPRMYKCVDATGKVYYSDKLNPDCARGSELNRQGVVMPKKKVANPAQRSKADAGVDSKDSQHQERRDRALMATYTTEEEIDAARDRTLAIPAQATKSVESKVNKINGQLSELKKQADALAAQKKPLPPRLLEDVNAHQKDLARLEADLAQRKAQSDSISAKFDADKLRFRELKGLGPQ